LNDSRFLVIEDGVPDESFVVVVRTNNTSCINPLGLVVENPECESITDVMGDTEPTARTFLGVRPGFFAVEIDHRFPKGELKIG
jgi:hypothetical protein